MLLAGDVGGTKTLLGLFAPGATRPEAVEIRSYRTLDFSDLGALCLRFLRDTSASASDVTAASFGVAGPIVGNRAQLTNVPWIVDVDALRREVPVPRAYLLNDLEALAWCLPVLIPGEVDTLRDGQADRLGSVALSAPTTTSVVFAVTSSADEPPRRITSACASFRPSDESFPVKTTT